MIIERVLAAKIARKFGKGKAILLTGPRQVGKTTLLKSLLTDKTHLFLDGDDPTTRSLMTDPNTAQLKNILGNHDIVFIDEAQRIANIGLTLKIIADQFKSVQLLISGSSAFELGNSTNEPLTGRKWEYQLFPLSWGEFEHKVGFVNAEQALELRLLYGMYPDIVTSVGEKREPLKELVNSYLYKDLLAFGGIRKPEILEKLLQALALQMGNEVSYNELAQLLGIDKNTVSAYIDVLIKGYVVFKLPSFSRNIRNEIKKNQKIYFWDTGIRNMVIGNFNSLAMRNDKGALWENFLVSERLKKLNYAGALTKSYFWRTTQQQEIDYIEEDAGKLSAFEFKWNPNAKTKKPKSFMKVYDTDIEVVSRDNFRSFLEK